MQTGVPTPEVRVAMDAHVDSPIRASSASRHPKDQKKRVSPGLELDGSACVSPLFIPY
jgi:hypothetical protein